MTKKGIFVTVLALVLMCAVTVAGTLAYLTATTNNGDGVKNTFIAAAGGKLIDQNPSTASDPTTAPEFSIIEKGVKKNQDGTYSLDSAVSDTKAGTSYEMLPGVDLPKTAFIKIVGKTKIASFLFLEVVEDLTEVEWDIDDTQWTKIPSLAGKGLHGGDIYVYGTTVAGTVLQASDAEGYKDYTVNIVKGGKVSVKSTASFTSASTEKLEFYGYLAQSTAGTSAADVFEKCGFVKKS